MSGRHSKCPSNRCSKEPGVVLLMISLLSHHCFPGRCDPPWSPLDKLNMFVGDSLVRDNIWTFHIRAGDTPKLWELFTHSWPPCIRLCVRRKARISPPYVVLGSVCFLTCDRPPTEVVVSLPWMDIAATNVWRWEGRPEAMMKDVAFGYPIFPGCKFCTKSRDPKKGGFNGFMISSVRKESSYQNPQKGNRFFVSLDLVKEVT